jgi:hypothetical protein
MGNAAILRKTMLDLGLKVPKSYFSNPAYAASAARLSAATSWLGLSRTGRTRPKRHCCATRWTPASTVPMPCLPCLPTRPAAFLHRRHASSLPTRQVHGGTDAPYVFVDLNGKSSWDMFSKILEEAQVVTIPGAGFGPGGEGFLRLSAFAPRASCEEACKRLAKVFS